MKGAGVLSVKTVEESRISIGNLMQPEHANHYGNVHGGEIMKLMDHAAGIVAVRHARTNVVTARVDNLEFHLPVHIGNLVTCEAHLVFVGRSSMEIAVTVKVEDLFHETEAKVALTAMFTMVALNQEGALAVVPSLRLTSDAEAQAFEEGRRRYEAYKQRRAAGR